MSYNSVLAYRMAAADGATHLGLIVLVYDCIAGDLAGAANAIRESDIGRRCSRSEHALILLSHLDNWVDLIDEPDLAASLHGFYAMLRQRIVQLQAAPDPDRFDELANLVSQTRAAWQAKGAALSTAAQGVASDVSTASPVEAGSYPSRSRLQLNA